MVIKTKPLHQQVLFITGASSGIGLSTVHLAVEQGCKVFMVSRNEISLQDIQNEMRNKGYDTAFAVCDVAEIDQLSMAVEHCLKTFGRIDTFVNNAGVSLFSDILDTSIDEARRIIDTNFWGVVNGCKLATEAMKEHGGVIINVGSLLSRRVFPHQPFYLISKRAIKDFTSYFNDEIKSLELPISVVLISPGSINTPLAENARSHLGDLSYTPPVFDAQVVARDILGCAIRPKSQMKIGSPLFNSGLFSKFVNLTPKTFPIEKRDFSGNLFAITKKEGSVAGDYAGPIKMETPDATIKKKASLAAFLAGSSYLLKRKFLS
jgi:NADP-dependent 3-hydroxy acid dehydrogenase YdfG